ncbi:MAG: HlyD family efflux transporter periplasmic adaptor subunit [Planctomycetes bacterium]|nr:HlyD family efflux transporter periplasmic adaptor subunit [Planctomycetota bacterium]
MAATLFTRTLRALDTDGPRRSNAGLAVAAAVLALWAAWFFLARVSVYEVTPEARIEVDGAVHPVEPAVSGRVVASHLALGREVREGEILVELDSSDVRFQLDEESARLAALERELAATTAQIEAEEAALASAREAAPAAGDEGRAREREADSLARHAEGEVGRLESLHAGGHLDILRAKSSAAKRRASADALAREVDRLALAVPGAEAGLEEARAKGREAEALAKLAEDEVARLERIRGGAGVSESEVAAARAEAERRRAAADGAGHEVRRREYEKDAAPIALLEAKARLREAETQAALAEEEASRLERGHAGGQVAEVDLAKARSDAAQLRAASDAAAAAARRLEPDRVVADGDRRARIEGIRRARAELEGRLASARVSVERLEHEIERRLVRAPVAGRLGKVAELLPGSMVREGDSLASVVPEGTLVAVASFLAPDAVGRIRPGQPARIRLEGFPWTRYGSVAARVETVASEARDGRVRVELVLEPDPASPIRLEHGLPGSVEVEVERVSPATLALRSAGKLLAGPARGPERGEGAVPLTLKEKR